MFSRNIGFAARTLRTNLAFALTAIIADVTLREV
jgi:hypothetical protein